MGCGFWRSTRPARRRTSRAGKRSQGEAFTQAQVEWIEEVLQEAQAEGAAVIGMMHHGVVEHWDGQAKLHPEYLVEEYSWVGELLASYGVRALFTGHYHAQDVALADYGENGFLYDIETGSLATAPCPIRYCELSGDELTVRSETIVDRLKPGTDFGAEARAFVLSTIASEAYDVSRSYKVSQEQSRYIADHLAPAFVAHYEGDEDPLAKPEIDNSKLDLWGQFIWSQQRYVADGLWDDPEPADNDVVLPLTR